MRAHGLQQMALRFTLATLLSSYCVCVCGSLSLPGSGWGAGAGAESSRVLLLSSWATAVYTGGHSHRRPWWRPGPHSENTDKGHLCQELSCPGTFALALPSARSTVIPNGNLPLVTPQDYSDLTSQPRLLFHLTPLPSPGFYCLLTYLHFTSLFYPPPLPPKPAGLVRACSLRSPLPRPEPGGP